MSKWTRRENSFGFVRLAAKLKITIEIKLKLNGKKNSIPSRIIMIFLRFGQGEKVENDNNNSFKKYYSIAQKWF